ncbi:uncharacterized protein LOC136074675 [Hydra vulgaris]|uniref:Uncharacterized protein LOC136074675 n=1 Tax=Hydra vulgaris TaxID=6087 RepID=A0ABM4B2N9_HYDVU
MKAFHQLKLAPESRSIISFQSKTQIKRFTRLNFGVNSAQDELQNALREVLKDIKETLNIADDVLIFALNAKQHDSILHKVLERFKQRVLGKQNPPAELLNTPTPSEVWDTLNIDYLGPLPNGFYLVVLIDQTSKFPIVDIINSISTDHLIDFLQKTIGVYGIPKKIISDNRPPFTSFKIKMFFNKLNIEHISESHLTNSQAEVSNNKGCSTSSK